MISIPKGTKDILPQDSYKWQWLEQAAREICRSYNAREIRTPVFEHTELFCRTIGEGTDVVGKEMYTFEDKGGRSITLKPEGTAGVARAYIENNLESLSLPLKMYYFTPVFRYERPQAGRLREHHQFGVEFYGAAAPTADFEVIALANEFLKILGVRVKLELNSIGCPECKPAYNAALVKFVEDNAGTLCPTCLERSKTNPMRVLDCKIDACRKTLANAPLISGYICADCNGHMDKVKKYLDLAKINYQLNPRIVRGLDYYTKTVFEFVTDALGAQGTVCGGGRYDRLVENLGGKPTPCVGFGLGMERLLMLMDSLGIGIPPDFPPAFSPDIVLVHQSEDAAYKAFELAVGLRKVGLVAEIDNMGRSVKAQLKYADKIRAKYAAVIGSAELASQSVELKCMADGKTETVEFAALADYLWNAEFTRLKSMTSLVAQRSVFTS